MGAPHGPEQRFCQRCSSPRVCCRRHNWRDQQFQRAMSSYQEGRSVWNRMSYVDNRRSGVGDGRWDAAGRYFDGEYYNDDRNTQSHKRSHRMVYYDADEDRNRWGGKHTRFY